MQSIIYRSGKEQAYPSTKYWDILKDMYIMGGFMERGRHAHDYKGELNITR